MLGIRIMDERLLALQRQGRIGFYGEARGQEAAVVGSAAAMQPQDWLVPALREAGAGIYRGLPLWSYVAQIFGNATSPFDPAQERAWGAALTLLALAFIITLIARLITARFALKR